MWMGNGNNSKVEGEEGMGRGIGMGEWGVMVRGEWKEESRQPSIIILYMSRVAKAN